VVITQTATHQDVIYILTHQLYSVYKTSYLFNQPHIDL